MRSLRLYNALVERCFKDCVDDFRSKNLAKDEEKVRRTQQQGGERLCLCDWLPPLLVLCSVQMPGCSHRTEPYDRHGSLPLHQL